MVPAHPGMAASRLVLVCVFVCGVRPARAAAGVGVQACSFFLRLPPPALAVAPPPPYNMSRHHRRYPFCSPPLEYALRAKLADGLAERIAPWCIVRWKTEEKETNGTGKTLCHFLGIKFVFFSYSCTNELRGHATFDICLRIEYIDNFYLAR